MFNKILICLFLVISMQALHAQKVGINASIGLRKEWKLDKKSSLQLRPLVQVTPEIKK
jgi:hypothetical protein